MKTASHNAILRSLHSMGFHLENAMHRKRHESDSTKLTEVQQQYQLDISGEAGTGAFTEFHIKFSEVLYYAPTQRNNKLEDPQMFWGAVLDEGADVFFTVHVSKWYMDESANYVGCVVRVGAMQAGYQGTGSVAPTPFKGAIHVTFQGLGIPLEDPGLDEPTTIAGGLPGQAGAAGDTSGNPLGFDQGNYDQYGGFPAGTVFRSGGELNQWGVGGSSSPGKYAPAGQLGSDKTWVVVASGPGSLSDFSFPNQVVEGSSAPPAAMQIGNFGHLGTMTYNNKIVGVPEHDLTTTVGFQGTVLTTASEHEVEVYDTPNGHPGMHPTAPENMGGSWYHGDKYAAIWESAGSFAAGTKLRAKFVMGTSCATCGVPGGGNVGIAAIVINMKDRRNGLAYAVGDDTGWIDDLRRLGEVQEEVGDFSGGQRQGGFQYRVGSGPSGVGDLPAGTSSTPSTGSQVGSDKGTNGVDDGGITPYVIWVEVWRRTDGIVEAAIYEDDPAGGAAPVWYSTFDTNKSPWSADYGPSKAGKWGFTFSYLTELAGTGLAEATIFRES